MLKNNHYLDKRTGLTLPVVAIAQVDTELGKATFKIGISREAIKKGNIIDTKTLYIEFDRTVNPYDFAYIKAKEQKEIKVFNNETQQYEKEVVDGLFTGWEDEYIK